jgi:hypothetical protein
MIGRESVLASLSSTESLDRWIPLTGVFVLADDGLSVVICIYLRFLSFERQLV